MNITRRSWFAALPPLVALIAVTPSESERLLEHWRQGNKRRTVEYRPFRKHISPGVALNAGIEVVMIGPFSRAGNLKYAGHPQQEWGACDAIWRAIGETREDAAQKLVEALEPFGELV